MSERNVNRGRLDTEPQPTSPKFLISEDERASYENDLLRNADSRITEAQVFALNTQDDLTKHANDLDDAGRRVMAGKIVGFMMPPDAKILEQAYVLLGKEAKRITQLPTGIANVAEHEQKHIDSAIKILEGKGVASAVGVPIDFTCCFSLLVYPNFIRHAANFIVPQLHISTLIRHAPEITRDDREAVYLEIILGAVESRDQLSPGDISHLISILRSAGDGTPRLNAMIDKLYGKIPENLLWNIYVSPFEDLN